MSLITNSAVLETTIIAAMTLTAGIVSERHACSGFPQSPHSPTAIILFGTSQQRQAAIIDDIEYRAVNFLAKSTARVRSVMITPTHVRNIPE